MNKNFLKALIDLLILLDEDENNAVTGIFSDKTIDKMNEIRKFILEELQK
jgi:hypothetical protein